MSTTPADPADIVERLCGQCGFPIHRSEGGLRHFGFYTAHRESRCRDIMHAEIAALRAREAELQRKLDAAGAIMEDQRKAAEYWAGCDEDCSPATAQDEIMRSGGCWPAVAHEKATTFLASIRGGE